MIIDPWVTSVGRLMIWATSDLHALKSVKDSSSFCLNSSRSRSVKGATDSLNPNSKTIVETLHFHHCGSSSPFLSGLSDEDFRKIERRAGRCFCPYFASPSVKMYVPPTYVPLGQSDQEPEVSGADNAEIPASQSDGPVQWSSGICACCDDIPSCCVGLFCPCYLFAKNAEFLGSESLLGPCMTHFMLWAVVNSCCCFFTDGMLLGLPGCLVSCYTCHYRRTLRSKYNLQEAPCGDFVTHFFCHPCAICQEYREICERCGDPNYADLQLPSVTAPSVQKMEPASRE